MIQEETEQKKSKPLSRRCVIMFEHPKDVLYNKGMEVFDDKDHDTRLLETEEVVIIGIFTAIVLVALLMVYVI